MINVPAFFSFIEKRFFLDRVFRFLEISLEFSGRNILQEEKLRV